MKICVTSQGDNLDAQIDGRFGRCPKFIFVDPDTMEYEVIDNPSANAMGGAGIQSGQLISSKGATLLMTGNIGPNAFQTLKAAGIETVTGQRGTVKEAIERYKKGEVKPTDNPSVGSKFGMGGGRRMF